MARRNVGKIIACLIVYNDFDIRSKRQNNVVCSI